MLTLNKNTKRNLDMIQAVKEVWRIFSDEGILVQTSWQCLLQEHAKISRKRKATDKVLHLIIFYRSRIWSETADSAVVSLKNSYRKLTKCLILTNGERVVSACALLPATFQICVFLINSLNKLFVDWNFSLSVFVCFPITHITLKAQGKIKNKEY